MEYSQSDIDSTPMLDSQAWESAFLPPNYPLAEFFSQVVADLDYIYDPHALVGEKRIDSYARELSVDEGSCSGENIADEELPDLEGKAYGSQDYL
jgi:hypothetical protein